MKTFATASTDLVLKNVRYDSRCCTNHKTSFTSNTIAETIMTKEVGCTLGKENGTRLTAAIAANTATRTISRETNALLFKTDIERVT